MRPDSAFRWNAKSERAAVLVALDEQTDQQIAQECGIGKATLARWKQHPEFAKRVGENVEATRQAVLTTGIADRVNRIRRINRDWQRLQRVIDSRAALAYAHTVARQQVAADDDPALADAPLEMFEEAGGMLTGAVVRKETPTKFGIAIEFTVDTGTLAELRAMEMQAAKELGQWTEKADLTTNGKDLVRGLTDDALDDRITQLKDREAQKALPDVP